MQENIRLLMEETGCEQGEAELALELAGQDLQKAIRTIESILRHIFALKGKFCFPDENMYGLLLAVINTKTQTILRLRTVVSYNPAIYENSPDTDWYALEKMIFSFRLDEGSIPDFTQDVEQRLHKFLFARKEIIFKPDIAVIGSLLEEFFAPKKIESQLGIEELNLAQFRRLPGGGATSDNKTNNVDPESGAVWLEVDLLEDVNGRHVHQLSEGEIILSKIVDTRDIAHYLAHLIGSRRGEEMIPLPAAIRKIGFNENESEIQVYYAPGIMGVARVNKDFRVKVVEAKTSAWWKKIIPWT